MELHLAAPRSLVLNKQEICISGRIGNSGNNPNLDHTNRLNFKANVAADQLIKNKVIHKTLEHFGWERAGKLAANINFDTFDWRLTQEKLVFQQNFAIRSYELGADGKISIGALVNILQESVLNHLKSAGIAMEGFGSTLEMSRRNLIWVVYRMQIVVDDYPSWGDVVQVETWSCASGKNEIRRDWLVRDHNTGKTLLRAVSWYVMMNKETRKLSKLIEETRQELKVILMDYCDPIIEEDGTKQRALDFQAADHVRTGLSPQWTDLDVNQHVNHVKYFNWILESTPDSIVETHKLRAMRLDFRKECGKKSLLQSLSALASETDDGILEQDHTLRLVENGSEILRARTVWMPRNV